MPSSNFQIWPWWRATMLAKSFQETIKVKKTFYVLKKKTGPPQHAWELFLFVFLAITRFKWSAESNLLGFSLQSDQSVMKNCFLHSSWKVAGKAGFTKIQLRWTQVMTWSPGGRRGGGGQRKCLSFQFNSVGNNEAILRAANSVSFKIHNSKNDSKKSVAQVWKIPVQ